MKVLAIGAHFDDVEIGCGGMLLKRVAQGDKVSILTITNSKYEKPHNNDSRYAEIARAEAQEAAKLIGAELTCLDKEPLNLVHNEGFSYEFDKVINRVEPDIVLTHWSGDFHSDHAAVALSSVRAARRVGTILQYRSNWYSTEELFNENYFVDISDYLERKLEVIRVYKSVLALTEYSWIEFVEKQNQSIGLRLGVKAAEAFTCLKFTEW
jgi:LmbE family N-acetylglucosaminyl deacetylase|tara:strand:- start:414 stop:1043 length:630 start_codon:yes stop_codon:yes gene_type:complete